MTYARLASVLLALAYTTSVAYQAYRGWVAEAPSVDSFSPWVLAAYAALMVLVWAVAADVRLAWWVVVVAVPANLLYGAVVLYPDVVRAREMRVVDWLEAFAFSGLLVAVLLLAVLRLRGTDLRPGDVPAA